MKNVIFLCLAVLLSICWTNTNAQTGFVDDFNDGAVSAKWQGSSSYSLSESGGIMTISTRTIQQNSVFKLNLGSEYDLSANAFVNLKLKTDNVCIVKMTLLASDGTKATKEVRLPVVSDNFVNLCFDFSALTFSKTKVNKVEIAFNPAATSYSGKVYFEDFKMGSDAQKIANLSPIQDMLIAQNASAKKIIVTDIENASAISLAGAAALIKNIVVSSISNNVATITFDCITEAVGTEVVTITATGNPGFSNNTSAFTLTVEGNNVPTVDQAANAKMVVGKNQIIKLTGISDGNASMNQSLTITATSSDPLMIPNPTVSYTQQSVYATLTVNPIAAGTETITVTINDGGTSNNISTMNFDITSYTSFNEAPIVTEPLNQSVYLNKGSLKVKLTGISDGDTEVQDLTIVATGKQSSVVSTLSVDYTQGRDTAIINLTLAGLGKDTITVSITDDGGNGTNNGDQTSTISFIVEVLLAPPIGYKFEMGDFTTDTTNQLWKIEQVNVAMTPSYIDTLGSRWIKLVLNQKSDWTGLWLYLKNIPTEINTSAHPYMSYQIMAQGFTPLLTHCYFYDANGERNAPGADSQRDTITTNIKDPHTVLMDYRAPDDQVNKEGLPIDLTRINTLLFNFGPSLGHPNVSCNGVVYIGDIRIGDSCKNIPIINPICTVEPMPAIVIWAGSGEQKTMLTGITNGKGNTTGVTLEVLSSKPAFMANPIIGTLNTDGTVDITYTAGSTIDSAQVIVRVSATGSAKKEMRFWIKTVSDDAANAVTINVDATVKGQTIDGFGGQSPRESHLADYLEQGSNLMRFFWVGNDIEINNDNADPLVMDRNNFNLNGMNIDYIRKASAAGVTDFFLTVLAPPSWMFQSLTDNSIAGAPEWSITKFKVDPMYYDEYVEFMVSIVRLVRDETGVELAALCPQNEPAFTEPYGSGILNPVNMAIVCGMLGKRLSEEGFATKVINSEQVWDQNGIPVIDFINAVKNNAEANQYTHIIGVHYPKDEVARWAAQWSACKTGTYPKQYWGTECKTEGNNYSEILKQSIYMTLGLNNGISGWVVLGYSQSGTGSYNDPTIKAGMVKGTTKLKHYYAFQNFAKYIRKGAVQLKTTSTNANVVAASVMHATDSTMTIVLVNKDPKIPYSIKLTGSAPANGWDVYRTSLYEKCEKVDAFKNGLYNLPPQSITTLIISTNVNHAPSIDQVKDKYLPKNAEPSTVNLAGITSGDPNEQDITITATSSNTDILMNPFVVYNSPDKTGTLTLAPSVEKTGIVTVTVKVKDNGGTLKGGVDSTTMKFDVYIGVSSVMDYSNKMSVYPNPAQEKINVEIPSELTNGRLIISNAAGSAVIEKTISGETLMEIDLGELSSGNYVIRIEDGGKTAVSRFVKK